MQQDPITVLLVEDDADEVLLVRAAIRDAGATDITLVDAETLQTALSTMARKPFDAVLLDLSLPDSSEIEGVAPVVEAAGGAPVIICTGLNDESKAHDAIRSGAQDYFVKNARLYGAIPRILRYAIGRSRLIQSTKRKVERARQYTELLLTRVISIANSGLGIADEYGIFFIVNPALAELAGCSASELMGNPWTNLLPKPDRAAELRAYIDSLSRDVDFDRERLRIRRGGGGIIEVPMRSLLVDFNETRQCRVLSFGRPSTSDSGTEAASLGGRFGDELEDGSGDTLTKLTADGLPIVSLERIRAELGKRWAKVAERVLAMAENTIAKRLSPGDTYRRDRHGDFVLCFDRLSEQEACFKAQAISLEIHEKALGRENVSEFAGSDQDPAT